MISQRLPSFAGACLALCVCGTVFADAPTAAQALGLKPIQAMVEYAIPSKEEAEKCTIRPEKEGNTTAWVIRDPQGQILRRFADTNGDNVVDLWCYYRDGIEVYRDVDSNFNKKADEYRWFNTAGMRWAVDKNEDGRVDSWRKISAHEVAEQVVLAIKARDPARFQLLLLTKEELNQLGFGEAQRSAILESLEAAPAGFSKLLSDQKVVGADSRYIDFGSARPGCMPAGTRGSTKDIIIQDNAAALVETGGKHEQVFLGTLVAVGDTWKLFQAPSVDADNQTQSGGFLAELNQTPGAGAPVPGAPSEEMQKLMAELEQLYRAAETLPPEKQAANVDQRAEKLQRLAEIAPEGDREQWYRQLAGMLSVAIQSGNYEQGFERLEELETKLRDNKASDDLVANVVFQRMWANYVVAQQQPGAEAAKVQEKWLADLQDFVGKYPKSADAAEALLQLGMYQEFVGKADEATKWYQQLVSDFPQAESSAKAKGALRRLNSVGKPIQLRGQDVSGGTVDLASYRGKVVLIQYWATWCEPCKADMVLLKDLFAKKGGREFDIIGVCLDEDTRAVRQFLSENRFPWKQVYEAGGLDGRLANELGVMTLPLMILVDQEGNVVNHNIHIGPELDGELSKLIQPTTGTANTRRGGAVSR